MMRLLGALALVIFFTTSAQAQSSDVIQERRAETNTGVVGLIAATRGGTLTHFADDIAGVLSNVPGLRVLPILGTGSLGNVNDLLFLRGVDVAFTQSDVIEWYRTYDTEADVENLGYIASMGLKEAHLLAPITITSVDELEGRRVNFGRPGSGSLLSASVIFDNLGLAVEAGTDRHPVAMEKLRKGEIDAMFWIGGSPIEAIQEVTAADELHLLPLPPERINALGYAPTTLTTEDYPILVTTDEPIETVAVSNVMAGYRFPEGHARRAAVKLFAQSLFENVDQLRSGPYHPKWKSMDLEADVPGWPRLFSPSDLELATN